ncbi:DMT family transporter [Ruicaihuangia caeni]|uniref:DMT family transporter n=1 Tax=Ruicaihuangia caeni TaxID=3042517 RepID=UPI00338D73A9
MPSPAARPTTALMFAGLCIVWGSSFLFMRVALDGGLTPFQLVWSREVLGGFTLVIIALMLRMPLPRRRIDWLHLLVLGLLNNFTPHWVVAWSQQYLDTSLSSIFNAFTPIATALMVTLAFRVERLTRPQLAGVLVGVVGVLIVLAPWNAVLSGDLLPQLAFVSTTLMYGISFGYVRRFVMPRGYSGVQIAVYSVGMAAGAMLLLTPMAFADPFPIDPGVLGSLLALGCLGTGIAYIWSFTIVDRWGATRASMVTYVAPVIGVALGVLVLGETLSWNEPLGAVLVLLGIVFAQRPRWMFRRPPFLA